MMVLPANVLHAPSKDEQLLIRIFHKNPKEWLKKVKILHGLMNDELKA